MRASVIVPAFNSAATVARCVDALTFQALAPQDYEIIVVDDGSTDGTANIVASFQRARCLTLPHGGAAAARNRGAALARGDILLFTDADCAPQPDWIQKMLAAFADPNVVGAKGTYRTRQHESIARFVQLEYEEKYARMRRAAQIDFVDTYSAAYRRDLFLAQGGFDESFPTASVEDQEFSFRLARHGYKMVFVPDAIVFHSHAKSLSAYVRRKFRIGYWKVRVHARHPAKVWRDSHTPPTLKVQVFLLLGALTWLFALAFIPWGWIPLAGFLCAFGLSTFPLILFIARRDATLIPTALGLIVARAAALALGLVVGIFGGSVQTVRWLWKKPGTGIIGRSAH